MPILALMSNAVNKINVAFMKIALNPTRPLLMRVINMVLTGSDS